MPGLIQIQLIFTLFLIAFAKPLPDSLIPVEYKLEIITNLGDEDDNFSFQGSVAIHIRCASSTDNIILHSKNLKIDDGKTTLKCLNETGDIPTVSETSLDAENDLLILKLSQTLQAEHHYEVVLQFEGDLEEARVGYYRGSYLGENDTTLWFAVTYFKPDNARRAFPCFDELTFKAKFTISLGRSTKYNSLSNMPLLETQQMENKDGWEWDRFQTTPPMSPYIVGFAITKYKFHENEHRKNPVKVPLRIWCAENVLGFVLNYILKFSEVFLLVFDKALNVQYPLPKLDLIAIPNYPVSAMESWGLIIWEEHYLGQVNFQFVSEMLSLVADQIIRQIFGNVVTIKSWTNLWFIEGVGGYIAPIGFDKVHPGMGVHKEHNLDVTDNIISVFNFDSHTISIPSNQSDHMVTTVDPNTVKKASLLIGMISHFVGRQNLREVLRHFLTIYKYKNAGSEELLELVDKKTSIRNVAAKTVMNTWITQPGFPLVTVTRNYKHGKLEVKQERFFMDDELLGTDKTRWWIPLTYTTECELEFNKTMVRKWFSPNQESVSIKGPLSPADFVIFNVDASSPYLVNYDERNWNLIIDFLNKPFSKLIKPLNRVLLIESAARLAWVGRLNYKIFLDLVKYVVKNGDSQPDYAALSRIYDLNILLKKMPVHEKFVNYMRKIFRPIYLRVKHDMARFMPKYGRMISGSCNFDMEDCGNGPIPPQRRTTFTYTIKLFVYSGEIFCADNGPKEYPWSVFKESGEIFFLEILIFLSCCENQTLIQDYLEECLHEGDIKTDDIVPIIIAIRKNAIAFDLVSEFLSKNIKVLFDRIFPNLRELSLLILQIGRHTVVESELTWFKNFIDTNQEYFGDIQSQVDTALEFARLNVQWHRKNYKSIEMYFGENVED